MESLPSVRSKTSSSSTRRTSLSSGHEKKKQPHVTQSDIHQLRLKTQYLDQQTKILRTQLNRVHDQINAKTKTINKTVGNSNQIASNSFKTKIEQLTRSIEAATDTKEKLEEQIEVVKNNDKGAVVVELQEELKMAYCELQRIHDEIAESQSNGSSNVKRLQTANSKVSDEYAKDLDYKINKLRLSNKDIKDKIIAYQKKIERNNIERELNQRNKEGKTLQYGKVEIEDNKRYRIEKFNLIASSLNDENAKFEEKVKLLNDVINQQREKIVNHLVQQSPRKETSRSQGTTKQEEEEANEEQNSGEPDINF